MHTRFLSLNTIKRFTHTMLKNIELTSQENRICGVLRDYAASYNDSLEQGATPAPIEGVVPTEPLTLRITGGWVRDKLLGQGSHDLDIAINSMTGEQFAMGLNEYLTNHYEKYGITPHSIHRIEKNPQKSKHLETATTKLFEVEIDFVNLRSEQYTLDSRIPSTTFGTPQQDALRRDATLNALFYNIQTGEIEDFTGRGLQDLRDGILRTPLPPKQTFLDDPLRALRLIRFAARFDFTIDDNALQEMAQPEINRAFDAKISKERVGNELEKILQGPNPNIALHLIQKTNLDNVIFFWHNDRELVQYNKENLPEFDTVMSIYSDGILNNHLLNFWNQRLAFLQKNPDLQMMVGLDPAFKQNYILGAALLPTANHKIIAVKKKLNNMMSMPEAIIREGLKMTKSDGIIVGKCVDGAAQYSKLVHSFVQDKSSLRRSELGLFIRGFNDNYNLAHYIAMVNEYLNETNADIQDQIIENYKTFHEFIVQQDLQDCHNLRPMIDGKKLQKILGIKGGPWMGRVNNEILVWQLDNPTGTEEQLLEYVKGILPQYMDNK